MFPCMIEAGKGETLCEGNLKRGHKSFTRKEPSQTYSFLTPHIEGYKSTESFEKTQHPKHSTRALVNL